MKTAGGVGGDGCRSRPWRVKALERAVARLGRGVRSGPAKREMGGAPIVP